MQGIHQGLGFSLIVCPALVSVPFTFSPQTDTLSGLPDDSTRSQPFLDLATTIKVNSRGGSEVNILRKAETRWPLNDEFLVSPVLMKLSRLTRFIKYPL